MNGRGIVLVVVLWVLALLTVLCLALAGTVQGRRYHLAHLRAGSWAEQSARSGLDTARAVLLSDPPAADTLDERWATPHEDLFVHPMNQGVLVLFVARGDSARLGLADEAARLNANTADAEQLARLPGMSEAVAEQFVRRRDQLAEVLAGDPADLARPVGGLTGPLRDEAQLAMLLGQVMAEQGPVEALAASDAEPPWANPRRLPLAVRNVLANLTVHSRVRNLDAAGGPRVNLNTASEADLTDALGDVLGEELIAGIVRARQQQPYASVGELLTRGALVLGARDDLIPVPLPRELARPIVDRLTVTDEPVLAGRVNVNTAPAEVLACLPGLDAETAEAIVAYRGQGPSQPETVGWLLAEPLRDALTAEQFATSCEYLTARSQQFRVQWVFLDPADEAAHYGQAVFERDRDRCGVLVKESYRAPRSDPQDRPEALAPLSTAF